MRYEFELSKNQAFTEAGIFWSDEQLKAEAVSIPVALPWLTGNPYALYARVRAITAAGVTDFRGRLPRQGRRDEDERRRSP